ncbi:IS21 family transposase [Cytobacillus firmus]|nr:IS21 family transposase [Cytobacillus firmus]MEC1894799.1 IS21 family transposase [Cytobacillus firmus]MED1942717.1 IS21 family transposase [Cytobacillus firmus]MED4450398.1 IS21 family transposase [Cytobacillus firmus]MED4770797.1 IS21 family transposase [Cytobacillus firmus]
MIRELHQKGWSKTAIAKETGFDRKTVGKYLKSGKLPQSKSRKKRGSKLDPFKPYLLQRIQEGTTNCAVLLEEIEAMGYEGKSTILQDFVKPFRTEPKKQATIRFETPPGRQGQMDWAVNLGKFEVNGEKKMVHAFIMTLSYSRMKYVEFTTDMKLETLIKCHMNAFSYFNGIPSQILYDNMRTVVIKHSPVEIRFNRKFEDFLSYYGVVPKACKPYRAQTKGKVERLVQYLKGNFFQRRLGSTLEELNAQVRIWLDQTANKKPNDTTKEMPLERWQKEQPFLQTWGTKPLFSISQWEVREVSKDCMISYGGNRYSVPYRFSGSQVNVRLNERQELEIYYEQELIAHYPLASGKAKSIMTAAHYEGLPGTKKEQEIQNHNGLATLDSIIPDSVPTVETRPLAVYAAFEEGDSE